MRAKDKAEHISCLETIDVRWKSDDSQVLEDWGNLLEIWPLGGVIHVGQPISISTEIVVGLPNVRISAKVQSVEQDEFGYYLQVRVEKPWFPDMYKPLYQLPARAAKHLKAS
jgi:hypothetical protein